jgi:hypothetical protein
MAAYFFQWVTVSRHFSLARRSLPGKRRYRRVPQDATTHQRTNTKNDDDDTCNSLQNHTPIYTFYKYVFFFFVPSSKRLFLVQTFLTHTPLSTYLWVKK